MENRFLKRLFDIMLSGILLVKVFPVIYLIVGTIIKLTSPGPIFFKQMRTGLNGREFKCYKFRSMRVNDEADKKQVAAAEDAKFQKHRKQRQRRKQSVSKGSRYQRKYF